MRKRDGARRPVPVMCGKWDGMKGPVEMAAERLRVSAAFVFQEREVYWTLITPFITPKCPGKVHTKG